jgi:hypothetical protein
MLCGRALGSRRFDTRLKNITGFLTTALNSSRGFVRGTAIGLSWKGTTSLTLRDCKKLNNYHG